MKRSSSHYLVLLASLGAAIFLAAQVAVAQMRYADQVFVSTNTASEARWNAVRQSVLNGNFKLAHHPKPKVGPPADPAYLLLPHWTSTFRNNGVDYPFTVLGTDPAAGQTSAIPTVIVPYRLVFADGTVMDPTVDLIDGVTPLQGVLQSPIFNAYAFKSGQTPLGTTQWGDAVMRGNFWSLWSTQGANYHILLNTPIVAPVQTVHVPAEAGVALNLGSEILGVVDADWFTGLMIGTMAQFGVPPTVLTIHLVSSVIGLAQDGGFFGGVHLSTDLSAYTHVPGVNTWIETSYFSRSSSVIDNPNSAVLAHEVAEWLANPLSIGGNLVPVWEDPFYPGLCANPLMEVADPLERFAKMEIPFNGRSYTFPDVAFLPWFARTPVNVSVNGWYSLNNTLTSYSQRCAVFDLYAYYTLAFLGVDTTNFTGLNDRGQVVGYVTVGNAVGSFVLGNVDPINGGSITAAPVYVPGSRATLVSKINEAGQIVGTYVDAGGVVHGFLLSGGAYTSIDFPGAIATEALGINNKPNPTIAGDYTDVAGVMHGFVLRGTTYSRVEVPFATNAAITGINDSEKITGRYDNASTPGIRGFTGSLGNVTRLPSDPLSNEAWGINNDGRVIATTVNGFGLSAGVLFKDGDFVLEVANTPLGWGLQTKLRDINGGGFVAGSVIDGTQTFGAIGVPLEQLGISLPASNLRLTLPAGMFGSR